MSHRLIVLPDDTADAIIRPIAAAKHSLDIRMFLFTDRSLLNAVIAARHRGVRLRVMLNPARRDGTRDNRETRDTLLAAGVDVRDSSSEFAVTHQKSMVIDDRLGFIESLNWETRDLTQTRDYAVETVVRSDIDEMTRCFEADWHHQPFVPVRESDLIWCPNNGRQRIVDFIDAARHSLWLQNERYQDMVIIERLVRAAKRGVRVHIMSRALHTLKGNKLFEGVSGLRIVHDVGAKVHMLKDLKLHGKIIIADEARAIVGSINLSPGSFDERRELAIETSSQHVVERLVETIRRDWQQSRKLPLSDEAVRADLEAHRVRDVYRLALAGSVR
jgi:phosphatidylserine/phosphatidylglycerophosphate/cardiolipin synthase-like enzyme